MISYSSFKNFILLNFFFILISLIQYKLLTTYTDILNIYLIFVGRDILLTFTLYIIQKNIKYIDNYDRQNLIKIDYKLIFLFLLNVFIETFTHLLIKNNYNFLSEYILRDLILFIPISFIYEILFDFFHYWSHRILHNVPMLYKYIHKIHHTHKLPTLITTYFHHPFDLLLTNSIPQILTLLLIPKLSFYMINIIIVHKVFLELSGHSGKQVNSSSFIQFIWLPRLFNIELYTNNHDDHHKYSNCNYAKRFSLWDKIFDTFREIKEN